MRATKFPTRKKVSTPWFCRCLLGRDDGGNPVVTASVAPQMQSADNVFRQVKENLGITAGTELPRRGRCSHYAKVRRLKA